MQLTILRHARAEDRRDDLDDFKRALVARGETQAESVGRFFRAMEWTPEAVLTSPLVRARQTAEGFCRAAEFSKPIIEDFLASGMTPQVAVSGLEDYLKFEHVVIVGHEPDLSQLIAWLTGAGSLNINVTKASIWSLECTSLTAGRAVLSHAVPFKLLKRLV